MRYIYKMALILLPVFMLSLTGCGSSSNGSTGDPFSNNSNITNGGGTGAIFGNISSATGKTGITVTTDRSTVDVNNGQVLVTARILKNGLGVSGVPVTFSIVAPLNGPATVEAGLTIVNTDANGEARTRITTGNTLSTTNVIVSATATIGTQFAAANTTFQIVRGTGVITVGVLPVKSATVDPNVETSQVFQQQIPIKLTDSNGNPRVGAPVTLSVYTQSGTSLVVFNQQTVNTDASGTAIFNATVTMTSPPSGLTVVDSVIYKAATNDADPIVAYAAGFYSLTSIVTSTTQPSIILTTDSTTYDINDGSVLATAKIVRNGTAVYGVPVTFSIVAPTNGPATLEAGLTTITTDSNGVAVTRIKTGNVASATNVIIQATAIVGTQTVNATATFQIVPDITQPSITLTTDRAVYDVNSGNVTAIAKIIKNGVAVFGVPVTYTVLSGPVTVGFFTPTTDRNGTSVATLTVGSARATSNAIIQATTIVEGTTYIAYTQFQVNGFDPTALPVPTVNVTLTADKTEVDVNNGTVMLNANLIYGSDFLSQVDGTQSFITHGTTIADQPVTFTVIAGPATITGSTLQTDKNGNSKAILTTGNALITTNVIVEASTVFDGKTYRAYTTIQLVRGGGVIMFTSAAGTSPGSQINLLTPGIKEVDPALGPAWTFMQLIPFKVTDSNGNPRVGVPVTLSVYSITTLDPSDVTIDFLVPTVTEPNQQTITTDSAGQGIFNATVTLLTPPPGGVNIVDVVFKAVTNDTIPVTAYVGNSYTLSSKLPPLTLAPSNLSFAAGDVVGATRTFAISGGVAPYTVNSSNTARVTVSHSVTTLTATLADASLWTEVVTISVLDSLGQTASATILRQ